MPVQASAHRLFGYAACAAVGICAFIQPASTPKRVDNTPLRFDPPAAGPRGPTRAEYEFCIEHPSLDGLYTDCSALLPDIPPKPATAAKPAKPR
jgi:hypothetical protein